jgi:acylphosphatase
VHRWELKISGRVQGVLFRRHAEREAVRLGLVGFVRNLADGSVECVVEGERQSLEAFLSWARRGPPLARVDSVSVTETEPQGAQGFQLRW